MSGLSVSQKIGLVFASLILLSVGVIAFLAYEIRANAQRSIDSLETKVQPMIEVGDVLNAMQAMRVNVRDTTFAFMKNLPAEKTQYFYQKHSQLLKEVDQGLQAAQRFADEGFEKDALQKSSTAWQEYKNILEQTLQTAKAANFSESRNLILTAGYASATAAAKPLIELQKNKKALFLEELDGQVEFTNTMLKWTGFVGLGLFSLLLFFANRIVGRVIGSISDAVKLSQSVAQGDMRHVFKSNAKDETGLLINSLGTMTQELRVTIEEVKEGVGDVFNTAQELNSVSATLDKAAEQQSSSSASTASAVEELSASVASVTESAQNVLHIAQEGLQRTNSSREQITVLVDEIGDVENSVNNISQSVGEFIAATKQISELSEQVKEIAEQTNLLALNAAIEAARAGEQGRGFAVVADEVRRLAEKSSESANTISTTTATLNTLAGVVEGAVQEGKGSIDASRKQAAQAVSSMSETYDKVTEAVDGVEEIARSMREQREATEQVARNIEMIAQLITENQIAIANNRKSSESLNDVAKTLSQVAQGFQV